MNLEARIRKLKKYREFPDGEAALKREELSKLLKIIFLVLDEYGCKPKYGSFILGSQNTKRNERMKRIVEFNFPCGRKLNCYGKERDSENLAWNTIYDASNHARIEHESAITYLHPNTPIYMCLNAKSGRFFAACYADSVDFRMQAIIYITIAKVIAMYYPNNPGLQESYKITTEKQEYMKDLAALETFIDGLFEAF